MSDTLIASVTWCVFAAHVLIGVIVLRRPSGPSGGPPLVPLMNLAVALCVLAYWAQRWYGYLTRHVTWYLTDQAVPLYAVVVCLLVFLALTDRWVGTWLQWTVFGLHTVVFLAASLFFSFFKMTRLF